MIAPIVLRTALFLTLLFCSTSALAQVQFIPSNEARVETGSPSNFTKVNFGKEQQRWANAMPWLKWLGAQSFTGSANSTSTFSFESEANTGTLSSTPGFPLSIIPSRHGFSRFSEPSLFFFMKSLVMSLPCASGPMTALDHPDKPPPAPSPITDNDVKLLSDCHGPAPDFTFTGTALTSADLDDALVGGSNNGHTAGSNGAVALWANADDGPDKLTFTLGGSFNIVDGLIVSRGHMQIGGSWNLLRHGTEYGIRNVSEPAFDLSGSDNCFSPKPDQVDRDALLTAPTGFPFASSFDPDEDGLVLEHFEPGSAAALAAMADSTPGPQYFVCGVPDPDGVADGAAVSSFCVGNSIVIGVQGTIIPTGLYYIPGTILINASNLEAVITMVAGEEIDVSGSVQGAENIFSPYVNPLLFASQHDVNDNNADGNPDPPATANTSDAEDAIETAGSFALFKGIIVATNGATTLDGQHNRFTCPVMGDRIRLKGSNNYFDVAACGERASVVTEIHAGNDHTTDIQGDTVDLGTSIHDKVTVSSNTDPQAPLTGTITVRQWNDGTCGIDGGVVQQTACFDEAGNPVAGCTTGTYASAVSVTIDNVLTFTPPVGVYSYKATYSGDPNNPGVADGLCEGPVTVVAPDLTPVKTNNVNDATVLGDPWVWTVTVSNQGAGNAHFLDGETVFTDNLPNPGGNSISYTGSGALTNPVGITGTINCARVGLNINCVASGPASIAAGGSFQVAVTATPLLTGSYTNPDGICRVDPTGHPPGNVPETDETNNNCSNTVNVTGPDLTPVKTNNVNDATVLGDPWVWTVTVNNNGTGAANFLDGETVFTDNLPNPGGNSITYTGSGALTNPVGITGTINCARVGLNINCVASGPASIAAGGSFQVAVTATPLLTGSYTNPDGICRVDPTGHPPGNVPETNETNNNCSNTVNVTGPDLTPTKTDNVNSSVLVGNPWVWTVTVNNNGTGAANFLNGETVFTDNLPNPGGISITYSGFTGLTNPVGITGTITCTLVSLNINCVASGPASIAAGGSFKVAVTATPQFTGTYTNPDGICRVDPTGHPPGNVPETNETNNDCSDSVTVNPRTPSLITTPNPPNGSVGTTLNDSGTLSGGFLPTGSITFRLFRPIDSTCTGTAAFTNVVPVNGNGVYNTTQGFVADVTGIWHWTAVYSGDVNNLGATSGCAAEPVNIGGPGATLLIIDEEGFDNGLHYHPDADFPPGGTIIPSGPSFFDIFEVNDDKPARNQRDVLQYFLDHPGDTITVRTGQVGDEGWFAPTCIPNRWLQGSNSKINNDCLSGADRATALNNFFGNNGEGAVPGFKDLPGEKDEEFRLDKIRAVMPLRALGLKELEGKNVCAVVYDSNISINYVSNSFPFTHGNLMGETLGIAAFKVELVRTLNGFSSSTLPEVVITILNAQTTCGTFELFNAPVPRSSSIPFDINGETPINHTNKNGYRRLKVFADLGLFF